MSARICLSLTAETLDRDLELLQQYRGLVDMAELRADFLRPEELPALPRFPGWSSIPAIMTLRRRQDGGRWMGDERDRRRCLKEALAGGYAYVDLEEDLEDRRLADTARARGIGVIRSLHDFQGVPADLVERLRGLPRHPAELPKAAVTPNDTRDLVALLEAFRSLSGAQKIIIGMGERGLFTRVLAGRLGSALS